eukprot:1954708-Rhodomonas_salina.1
MPLKRQLFSSSPQTMRLWLLCCSFCTCECGLRSFADDPTFPRLSSRLRGGSELGVNEPELRYRTAEARVLHNMVLDQVYDRGDDESRECSPPVFNWSSEEESVDDAAKPKYKKAYLMQKLMSEKEEDEESGTECCLSTLADSMRGAEKWSAAPSEDEEKAKNRIGPCLLYTSDAADDM